MWSALAAASCSDINFPQDPTRKSETAVRFVEVALGLEAPVYVTSPVTDPRLFIVEQPGRIRVVRDGNLVAEPFLDITDRVSYGGERGLLGLAFDPDFRASGRFFVYYTDLEGRATLSSFRAVERSDRARRSSEQVYLVIEQPFANHNDGQIAFGPDRMIYVGVGDGGGAGDPFGHGQNAGTLLGTILRLDVLTDFNPPYRIPEDNPFVGDPARRPEVWHFGLRNPWRFSFDDDAALLYIADVGQDRFEEINVVPSSASGRNFGWSVMEGTDCFGAAACEADGLELPRVVYGHADGCSVTGGYVYRGRLLPDLVGRYFYADYCEGWVRSFHLDLQGQATDPQELGLPSPGRITSFGEDASGELYVVTREGAVLLLAPGT
ncbi:MAG: PQQ-dependent sugar dehydrogenase [Gemmatimonadota bacterium]